jgi:hypothetical protein
MDLSSGQGLLLSCRAACLKCSYVQHRYTDCSIGPEHKLSTWRRHLSDVHPFFHPSAKVQPPSLILRKVDVVGPGRAGFSRSDPTFVRKQGPSITRTLYYQDRSIGSSELSFRFQRGAAATQRPASETNTFTMGHTDSAVLFDECAIILVTKTLIN